MNQIKIHVIELKAVKAFIERPMGRVVPIIPELGCNEQLWPRHRAGGDRFAHADFIAIYRSSVDGAISGRDGGSDNFRGFPVCNLPDAKAKLRNQVAVV